MCNLHLELFQWGGQRPHKSSRSRRVNVVSPVSCNAEAQVSSEGFPASDFSHKESSVVNSGYQLANSRDSGTQKYKRPPDDISLLGLPESEGFGAVENKLIEKVMNNCDFTLAAEEDGSSKLQIRKNKIPTDEFGDCVQRQGGTGRNLSLIRTGLPSGREKSENLPMLKKYGRLPSKKQKDREVLTRIGQMLNNNSSDFAGEYDDNHEELYQAAKSAHNASNLACSGPFWLKMESIFATISEENVSYLKQQLNFAEELDKTSSLMLGIDHNMGVVMNNEVTHRSEKRQRCCFDEKSTKTDALIGKCNVERLDKVTPFFQRLLSAIIPEDENEELYPHIEAKNISQQCASDDSHGDSCNQFDFELRDLDKMDFEIESKVDFQIQKNCLLDRLSCSKSIASNTFRYANTSTSLQSTEVWQGDEEFSHSDITDPGKISSNDLDQLQHAELSGASFPFSDSHYQLMYLDDKLLLEMQSIGLYPEILPDLAEEDEAKNQDIVELKEELRQQIGSRKKNLDRIDRAIQKGRDTERKIELVAFDQLIEMAYRKILACRGSKNSKGAAHKVSKQVALVFVKRALERCKKYEETGNSCFSEPDLQHIIFSTSSCENVAKSADCIVSGRDSNTCNKASDLKEASKAGAVSSASEKYDSHRDNNVDMGLPDSLQGSIHLSEQVSSRNGALFIKEKKREMLVNGVGGGSSLGASNLDGLVHGGVKGKRSERDRNQSRDQTGHNSISSAGCQSLDSSQNDYKTKAKPKQMSNCRGNQDRFMEAKEPASSSIHGSSQSVANAGNNGRDGVTLCGSQDISKVKESAEFGNLQIPELDSIEELGVSSDLGGHQDLSTWLNFDEDALQDHDSVGLEIPMDDLSELSMII